MARAKKTDPSQTETKSAIAEIGPAGSTIAATDFVIQPKAEASASKIHSVSINSGWTVDKLQVQYENPATNPTETYHSDAVGGEHGSPTTFQLPSGDYLTSVSGTWGSQAPGYPKEEIVSLQFHTHQGNQSQVFGGGNSQKQVEPFTLIAPEGSEIIGFFGAYGSHQNGFVRLGIYTRQIFSGETQMAKAKQQAPTPPVKLQARQMVLVLGKKHQSISAGGGALRPKGCFTIEAWVCPATDTGKQVIYAEGEALLYLEGGELKFQISLSSEAIASSGAGIKAGSWYHVAVTRAGNRPGSTKLYINGVQNDNQAAISPVLSFGNTYLGGHPDVPDSRLQGKLLEVRVWRYARSLSEIEENRLYPLTGRELGLVRCWSFNEQFGTTPHDKTTSRAIGTVAGEASWEEFEIPIKTNLNAQERLTRSTGLEDYGYWFKEMTKQQKTEADQPFRRGRIWH